jgi:hypothetical protein
VTASAEERSRTMQVRALRRLSECEMAGVGLALQTLEAIEGELVQLLPEARRAAAKEAAARSARGLAPHGPFGSGREALRRALLALTDAREELSYTEVTRKVRKR